jgi:hypothetical protein
VDEGNAFGAVAAVVFVTSSTDALVDDVVNRVSDYDVAIAVENAAACGKLDSLKVDAVTDAVVRAARDVKTLRRCCT